MSATTSWDSTVSATEYAVHHGVWTNWSRGRIMGATLTLSRTDGNYLLSFTAVFISLVSTRFWRILCFIAHKKFSTKEPRDALHHQRQAILRNSASPLSSLWTLSQLVWTWRGVADRLLARAMPVIITAVLCAATFTLAGGFSSQLSTGISNEVLLDGSRCGYVDIFGNNSGYAGMTRKADLLFNAASYAQQCYSVDTSRGVECSKFVQPKLTSIIDRNATCPFDYGICRSNTSNIYLDTGYIDTSKLFGINAPANQRILFRSTLRCAPLRTENYSYNITLPSGNFTRYYYGPSHNNEDQNFTHQASQLMSQYPDVSEDHSPARGKALQVAAKYAFYFNGTIYAADFNPIPELSRDDADLTIAFLSGNGVRYKEKTIDPWYRGTVPNGKWKVVSNSEADWLTKNQTAYIPEEAASPLGCLQQYQICNVDSSNCGPLRGFYDYQEQSIRAFSRSEDKHVQYEWYYNTTLGQSYDWFTGIVSYGTSIAVSDTLSQLGVFSLSSQNAMSDGYMQPLLENQWQLDVERWWATGLASMQAGLVDAAVGPPEDLQPYTIRPKNSHIQDSFCNSQKILSTNSTSFSVFGIYVIYVAGTIIVAVSYLLEPLQNFLDRRKKTPGYARLEWATTESLQLQRAAYQGIGSGTWTGHLDAIPVTKPDELLDNLPHTYDTEFGSSIIVQGKLSVEEPKPATIPLSPAEQTSDNPDTPAEEGNRDCTNCAERTAPTVSRDSTQQSADSCRPEETGSPRDASVPLVGCNTASASNRSD